MTEICIVELQGVKGICCVVGASPQGGVKVAFRDGDAGTLQWGSGPTPKVAAGPSPPLIGQGIR